MESSNTIIKRSQYEILESDGKIFFINRKSNGFFAAGVITGGIGVVVGMNMIMQWAFGDVENFLVLMFGIPASILLLISAFFLRQWFVRQYRTSLEEILVQYIADTKSSAFLKKTPDGEVRLTALSDVHTDSKLRIFDHSQGFMRDLILSWPDGKAAVLRTNSGKEIAQICEFLEKNGITPA